MLPKTVSLPCFIQPGFTRDQDEERERRVVVSGWEGFGLVGRIFIAAIAFRARKRTSPPQAATTARFNACVPDGMMMGSALLSNEFSE